MEFEYEIYCTGRDGIQRMFYYCLNESIINETKNWVFMVIPESKIFDDWFEFTVTEIGNRIGKVTMMKHREIAEYVAMGIPEAMIVEAKRCLNLNIISSSNKLEAGEFRTPHASKVWNSLIDSNLAEYHEN